MEQTSLLLLQGEAGRRDGYTLRSPLLLAGSASARLIAAFMNLPVSVHWFALIDQRVASIDRERPGGISKRPEIERSRRATTLRQAGCTPKELPLLSWRCDPAAVADDAGAAKLPWPMMQGDKAAVAVMHSNRSAACLGMGAVEEAAREARLCTQQNAAWSKGYARLGEALLALGQWDNAVDALKDGLELDPHNAAIQDTLQRAVTSSSRHQ
ncbi:hypothetical protein CYMTET_50790 [Cymbomonas tetramitiformis]|uniref:Tetratricopeptide repeat protein n=1 Tax=Cymbomonas tetramitiformis TaxID=36881 RepID=A0AAE0ESG4_9CHLO|nr:hypothetical protein CYMTET_50790 [Cymbomonas tetramitiformis]